MVNKSSLCYDQILIYSDSTAMPRNSQLNSASTWPFLFSKQIAPLSPYYLRGFGGIKSFEMVALLEKDLWYFDYKASKPSEYKTLVVLAFGIVDAAILPF